MQELVEYIVTRLVSAPDEVSVTPIETDYSVVYEVSVADDDIGRVIGRHGRIANALRTLVRSASTSDGKRHAVEILS